MSPEKINQLESMMLGNISPFDKDKKVVRNIVETYTNKFFVEYNIELRSGAKKTVTSVSIPNDPKVLNRLSLLKMLFDELDLDTSNINYIAVTLHQVYDIEESNSITMEVMKSSSSVVIAHNMSIAFYPQMTIEDYEELELIDEHSSVDFTDEDGRFETYSTDRKTVEEYISEHGEEYVWTFLSDPSKGEDVYICGYHPDREPTYYELHKEKGMYEQKVFLTAQGKEINEKLKEK
ncbi:hypothetical protein JHD46_05505 [Sulfurimonas sp. SAG-AH-194-C20]|nr:hypothetical protein [Sulfurimonas sp. SAG-AH-194-C20]MDF1879096.1 hypothetical protein [Sulfurimonas sp. SAG-AH-194-C20]